jgi:hypothetical protein
VNSVEKLLDRYRGKNLAETYAQYDKDLAGDLQTTGYLSISGEEGYGPLEAALLVEAVAKLERVVEIGASSLVAPQLRIERLGPYAMTSAESLNRAIRFLPVANTLIIDAGDRAYVAKVDPGNVELVSTVFAFPFGRLRQPMDLGSTQDLGPGSGARLRQWWQVSFALEALGAAQAALDHVLAYVKDRKTFGRAVGSYQAVQHRLANCVEFIHGGRWLTLKAAWSGLDEDAAMAATFVQDALPQLCWDFHQFSGAQGWVLSNPLHFWTFRLRMLMGEMGSIDAQALSVSDKLWPQKAQAQ